MVYRAIKKSVWQDNRIRNAGEYSIKCEEASIESVDVRAIVVRVRLRFSRRGMVRVGPGAGATQERRYVTSRSRYGRCDDNCEGGKGASTTEPSNCVLARSLIGLAASFSRRKKKDCRKKRPWVAEP